MEIRSWFFILALTLFLNACAGKAYQLTEQDRKDLFEYDNNSCEFERCLTYSDGCSLNHQELEKMILLRQKMPLIEAKLEVKSFVNDPRDNSLWSLRNHLEENKLKMEKDLGLDQDELFEIILAKAEMFLNKIKEGNIYQNGNYLHSLYIFELTENEAFLEELGVGRTDIDAWEKEHWRLHLVGIINTFREGAGYYGFGIGFRDLIKYQRLYRFKYADFVTTEEEVKKYQKIFIQQMIDRAKESTGCDRIGAANGLMIFLSKFKEIPEDYGITKSQIKIWQRGG